MAVGNRSSTTTRTLGPGAGLPGEAVVPIVEQFAPEPQRLDATGEAPETALLLDFKGRVADVLDQQYENLRRVRNALYVGSEGLDHDSREILAHRGEILNSEMEYVVFLGVLADRLMRELSALRERRCAGEDTHALMARWSARRDKLFPESTFNLVKFGAVELAEVVKTADARRRSLEKLVDEAKRGEAELRATLHDRERRVRELEARARSDEGRRHALEAALQEAQRSGIKNVRETSGKVRNIAALEVAQREVEAAGQIAAARARELEGKLAAEHLRASELEASLATARARIEQLEQTGGIEDLFSSVVAAQASGPDASAHRAEVAKLEDQIERLEHVLASKDLQIMMMAEAEQRFEAMKSYDAAVAALEQKEVALERAQRKLQQEARVYEAEALRLQSIELEVVRLRQTHDDLRLERDALREQLALRHEAGPGDNEGEMLAQGHASVDPRDVLVSDLRRMVDHLHETNVKLTAAVEDRMRVIGTDVRAIRDAVANQGGARTPSSGKRAGDAGFGKPEITRELSTTRDAELDQQAAEGDESAFLSNKW